MSKWASIVFQTGKTFIRSRAELALEIAALRQQLAVFKDKHPKPKLTATDRIFWVVLRRITSNWQKHLIIVKPDAVVRWHRKGFRLFWRWKSRKGKSAGRPRISREIRKLIHQMVRENNWGAPRIHGELLKLGFEVDERTVSRYLPRRSPSPDEIKRWKVFFKNHVNVIAAMDFFTVPTATFQILYVLVILHHGRRRILHVNVTSQPNEKWVIQQLRIVFDGESDPRYLIFDRDPMFSSNVRQWLKDAGIKPKRTSVKSPWQNGIAERWILSCRKELLDHLVVFGERHLRKLVNEYVKYYQLDRCHLSLEKDAPAVREVIPKPSESAMVVSLPRVGGIHHRYDWKMAA